MLGYTLSSVGIPCTHAGMYDEFIIMDIIAH